MGIKPLYDRVVVRRLDAETTTAGGIIIPDKAAEKPTRGEVIAVGGGARTPKGVRPPQYGEGGGRGMFGQDAGTEVEQAGEKLLVMKESDILAVIGDAIEQEKAA